MNGLVLVTVLREEMFAMERLGWRGVGYSDVVSFRNFIARGYDVSS